jgi:hypothetical protein
MDFIHFLILLSLTPYFLPASFKKLNVSSDFFVTQEGFEPSLCFRNPIKSRSRSTTTGTELFCPSGRIRIYDVTRSQIKSLMVSATHPRTDIMCLENLNLDEHIFVIPVRVELTFSLVKSHILLRNHLFFIGKWSVYVEHLPIVYIFVLL